MLTGYDSLYEGANPEYFYMPAMDIGYLENIEDLVEDQDDLPKDVGYGLLGNANDHSCGAISAHNAILLMDDDSNFRDAYNYFDKKTVLGVGLLGTDPIALSPFLKDKGYSVQSYAQPNIEKAKTIVDNSDVGIILYINIIADSKEAHYFAIQEATNGGYDIYNMSAKGKNREVTMEQIYDRIYGSEFIFIYGINKE